MSKNAPPHSYYERRHFHVAEIWAHYKKLGVEAPSSALEPRFQTLIPITHAAVAGDTMPPHLSRSELLGNLYYELGLSHHGTTPDRAAYNFRQALRYFAERRSFSSSEQTARGVFIDLIHLLHARASAEERSSRLQQNGTVRNVGRAITGGLDRMRSLPKPERDRMMGTLFELAFVGTILANPDKQTEIATLTTDRQDRPMHRHGVKYRTAIAGVQEAAAVDLNIYKYNGTAPRPAGVTLAQVKAAEPSEDGLYRSDILMLYGDRDLFVENLGELRAFARSLTEFRGEPDHTLATAISNIQLAQEVHAEALGA